MSIIFKIQIGIGNGSITIKNEYAYENKKVFHDICSCALGL